MPDTAPQPQAAQPQADPNADERPVEADGTNPFGLTVPDDVPTGPNSGYGENRSGGLSAPSHLGEPEMEDTLNESGVPGFGDTSRDASVDFFGETKNEAPTEAPNSEAPNSAQPSEAADSGPDPEDQPASGEPATAEPTEALAEGDGKDKADPTSDDPKSSEATSQEEADAETDSSDDDPDAEDDKSESEFWYVDPENPEGTRYRTVEDARRGIKMKDEVIHEQKENLSSLGEKLSALQTQLQEKEAEVESLASTLPDDQREYLAVQEYLPEEFRGKTRADFADDDALLTFKEAMLDAKAKRRHALKEQKAKAEAAQKAYEESLQRANKLVEEKANPEFFDATAPELQIKLQQKLETPEEAPDNSPVQGASYSALQKAAMIAQTFGEADAERFLNGLKTEFHGSLPSTGGVPKPAPKPTKPEATPSPSKPSPPKETVKTRPDGGTKPPPARSMSDMSAREMGRLLMEKDLQRNPNKYR